MSTPSSAQLAAGEIKKRFGGLGVLEEIADIISKHTQGEEEWRPVISGNGAHEVSTMGRVRSFYLQQIPLLKARISELESENQNHAEHVLLERGLRQAAEAKASTLTVQGLMARVVEAESKSGDVAKLRTALVECSGIIKLLYRGQTEQIVSTCNEVLDRVNAALASVPAETERKTK